MDAATKIGINVSKKVIHKAAEATCEFLRSKIAHAVANFDDKIMKPDEKSRNDEKIIVTPEKREEILSELRQVL